MLGKLIKHELKVSLGRMWGCFVAIAAATGLILLANSLIRDNNLILETLGGLSYPIYILVVIAVPTIFYVIVVYRFYQSVMGDEGYLTFTLPVSADQILHSRIITAVIGSLLTGLCVTASIFLVVSAQLLQTSFSLFELFADIIQTLSATFGVASLFILALIMFLSLLQSILSLFWAMSVGPHILKNRLGGSVLAYVIYYVSCQILSAVMITVATVILSRVNIEPIVIFIALAVYSLLLCTFLYLMTRHFLNKKLNLA